jgi:hypothetical protein
MNTRMSKLVCVRFSDQEYDQLRQLCQTTNTRTISDLARTAIEQWMMSGAGEESHSQYGRVADLEQKLSGLAAQVEELSKRRNGR